MELSMTDNGFLNIFESIIEKGIDEYNTKQLNVFMVKTTANDFSYDLLQDKLLDSVIDFALSRQTKLLYEGRSGKLSKEARQRFRTLNNNTGELGELLVYCFLESHLKAPKIFSKYELKTSPNDYVKGSDGVHYLNLGNEKYQLIFCESKTYKDIGSAINDAFLSIKMFKEEKNEKDEYKPGLKTERSLISSHLKSESSSIEEYEFIKSLIYPSKNSKVDVDDAFAVFIGYEMDIKSELKKLANSNFRDLIKIEIQTYVENQKDKIIKKIDDYDLHGHSFYFYFLPFTNLEQARRDILKEVIG